MIDISNPNDPQVVGYVDTEGFDHAVAISGHYAYIAAQQAGLRIINVTNPNNPYEVGYFITADIAHDVAVSGNYAYVAIGWGGLQVIDVSNPTDSQEVGRFAKEHFGALALKISAGYAYVVAQQSGLCIFDVSSPTNFEEVGYYCTGGFPLDIALSGRYAYVADGDDGLYILEFLGTPQYITPLVNSHALHQEFYVDIQVKDVENLFGVVFKFNFPPDKLEVLSPEKGDFLGTDPVFFPDINNSTGVVSVGISKKAGQSAVSGTGIVAKIKVKEKPTTPSGITINLSLSEIAANDPSGNSITLTPQNTSYVTPKPNSVADREAHLPEKYALYPNYPNPFNPTTTISYALPEAAHALVQIFDVNGREVKRLVDQVCNAGIHSVVWNGTDEAQQKISSGIYLCRFSAGDVVLHQKLILTK